MSYTTADGKRNTLWFARRGLCSYARDLLLADASVNPDSITDPIPAYRTF